MLTLESIKHEVINICHKTKMLCKRFLNNAEIDVFANSVVLLHFCIYHFMSYLHVLLLWQKIPCRILIGLISFKPYVIIPYIRC